VRSQRRLTAEDLLELRRERLVLEFVAQPPQQIGLHEHLRAGLDVELQDVLHRHADRQSGRDDAASAGAGDVVERMGEPEIAVAAWPLEDVLDRLQHFEREHAADAASVDGEELLRTLALNSVLQRHCRLRACCGGRHGRGAAAGFRSFVSLLRPKASAGWPSGGSRRWFTFYIKILVFTITG